MKTFRIGFLAAFAAFAAFAVSSADAHPQVKAAGPAPGSVVKESPKAVRIQFNEAIVVGFSGMEITNEKGEKQAIGAASNAANDKAQLIVPVNGTLAPGKYTVAWHAVGDDTHKVEGKFNFEVKP
jgi:methionine-rich copper-binding protein CopC